MIKDTETSHQRKSIGEQLQLQFAEEYLTTLQDVYPLTRDDIYSNPMSLKGEDIVHSPKAREVIPEQLQFSFECKRNVNGYTKIYADLAQASQQAYSLASIKEIEPIAIVQKDEFHIPLAVMSYKYFLKLFGDFASMIEEGKSK